MATPSSRSVAAGAALLFGLLAVFNGAHILSEIPANPRGDGFAAGLAAMFGLGTAVTGGAAILEAGVLAAAVRFDASGRVRRLLTAACAVGALAALLTVPFGLARLAGLGSEVGPVLFRLSNRLLGIWPLVTLGGMALAGAGVLLWAVEALTG